MPMLQIRATLMQAGMTSKVHININGPNRLPLTTNDSINTTIGSNLTLGRVELAANITSVTKPYTHIAQSARYTFVLCATVIVSNRIIIEYSFRFIWTFFNVF